VARRARMPLPRSPFGWMVQNPAEKHRLSQTHPPARGKPCISLDWTASPDLVMAVLPKHHAERAPTGRSQVVRSGSSAIRTRGPWSLGWTRINSHKCNGLPRAGGRRVRGARFLRRVAPSTSRVLIAQASRVNIDEHLSATRSSIEIASPATSAKPPGDSYPISPCIPTSDSGASPGQQREEPRNIRCPRALRRTPQCDSSPRA